MARYGSRRYARKGSALVPALSLIVAGVVVLDSQPAVAAVPPSATAVYDLDVYAGGTSAFPATNGMSAVENIDFDSSGNLYAADYNNFRIVKISPSHAFTVIAGNGGYGSPTPGPATSTPLGFVTGVAVEANGDVLAADPTNALVYRITAAGQLSVVAGGGGGTPSSTPAAATSVSLNSPSNVVADPSGGFYIVEADTTGRVSKVSSGGQISVVAGGGVTAPTTTAGPATAMSLSFPSSAALAADGTLYLVDAGTYVEKITPAGQLSVVAGDGTTAAPVPGPATASPMGPQTVTLDSAGNLIISDNANGRLEKITPAGTLSVIGGDGTVFPPLPAVPGPLLNSPLITVSGLAVNPLDSEIYIASRVNSEIYRTTVRDLPAAPTALNASAGDAQLALTFNAPGNIGGAAISAYQTSIDAGATWQALVTTGSTSLTGSITGLTNGTTYTVRVRAVNSVGAGPASVLTTATPTASVPPPVPSLPAPSPAAASSTGAGRSAQTAQVSLQTGQSLSLLQNGRAVTRIVVDEVGVYLADPTTGVITFTPAVGFTGVAAAVTFQVSDAATGLSGTALYTVTVTVPAPPSLSNLSSTGSGSQGIEVDLPADATLALVGTDDVPTTRVPVTGQGAYTLDAVRSRITFIPTSGFAGRATPVTYRVSDAYDQHTDALYSARVVAPAPPSRPGPPTPAPTPIDRSHWVKVPRNPNAVHGKERRTQAFNASFSGIDAYPIPALKERQLRRGQATTLSGDGLFTFDRATLTAEGRSQVKAVVHNLEEAVSVRCEGYTDYAGSRRHEMTLSRRRAHVICTALRRYGADVTTMSRGYGPRRPAVVGGSARGRKENRRVVIVTTR
ncbi:OmpA family protein [Kineosporia mesophila]|nr:OmpA family protein [Kineosporia mesophila]MCD5352090.1 OmpA family protein [Kineosporia mesophila]